MRKHYVQAPPSLSYLKTTNLTPEMLPGGSSACLLPPNGAGGKSTSFGFSAILSSYPQLAPCISHCCNTYNIHQMQFLSILYNDRLKRHSLDFPLPLFPVDKRLGERSDYARQPNHHLPENPFKVPWRPELTLLKGTLYMCSQFQIY